jgi:hypothetical protein
MELEFKYKFSTNYIKFKLIEELNEVWMEDVNIDYEHPKIFFLLLRNAIDKFIEQDYKYFIQTVLKEDWEYIKQYNWQIKTTNDTSPTVIITCDINDAMVNIAKGLGFTE